MDEKELLKVRLDYTWKYFDSASRHRMLFINFFLVATGILANAYGLALREQLYAFAIYVCVFGLLSSIAFCVLDYRMLTFVQRSNDVLDRLERDVLFPDGYDSHAESSKQSHQLGMARLESEGRNRPYLVRCWSWLTKVKVSVRLIQIAAAVGFALGLVFAVEGLMSVPPTTREPQPTSEVGPSDESQRTTSAPDG